VADGVFKSQPESMQCLSIQSTQSMAAVQAVTHQWMSNAGHVNPDLVGSAGVQVALHPTHLRARGQTG
jgi:hypothetical protein